MEDADMDIAKERSGFISPSEFERFEKQVELSAELEMIPVRKHYSGNVGFHEKWFVNRATQQVFRLVTPAWPFRGVWEVVPEHEL